MRKFKPLLAIAILAASAGCASIGSGLGVSATPVGLSMPSTCYVYGNGYMAMTMGAGPRFWGLRAEAKALQARFSPMRSDIHVGGMNSWKEAARGC